MIKKLYNNETVFAEVILNTMSDDPAPILTSVQSTMNSVQPHIF